MGDHFRENIKLTIKLIDTLMSPILLYGNEMRGIDHNCNGKIDRDLSELVQNKLSKWVLSVKRYCIDNACRALTGSQ